jgi:hypothetical protein
MLYHGGTKDTKAAALALSGHIVGAAIEGIDSSVQGYYSLKKGDP